MTREEALNQYTYNAGVIERTKTELDRLLLEQKNLKAIVLAQQLPDGKPPKQIRQKNGINAETVGTLIRTSTCPVDARYLAEHSTAAPSQIQDGLRQLLKQNIISRSGSQGHYKYSLAIHRENLDGAAHGIA